MKILYMILIFALILCFIFGCQDKDAKTDVGELNQHMELVQSWAEAVNNQDFDRMEELMAEDYVWHFPGREVIGLDNVMASFSRLYKAFPDMKLSAEDIINMSEKVVVRWDIKGTHRGEYLGCKPTNKFIHYSSISIDKVVDGKFAEGWEIYDEFGLREQIGSVSASQAKLEVEKVFEELQRAVLDSDIETLDRIYADDYILTTRKGITNTKAGRLAKLKSGELDYLESQTTDVETRVLGDMAVVTGQTVGKIRLQQGNVVNLPPRRFTCTFAKKDRQWRLLTRHSCEIEQKDEHESQMRELLRRYMEASNNHDIDTLISMTADDAVWLLGPYKLEGKENVIKPNKLDEGANTRLEYRNVLVKGNTVEFELIERNDISDALGTSAAHHYPRFTFRDGLVIRKEPWKNDAESSEKDKKIWEAFRKWVREEKPEERAKFIDLDGNLIFSRESGIIMSRLAKEWREIQEKEKDMREIKQIHKAAALAMKMADVDAYVRLFTEDGIYMWPNSPSIIGRKALQAWFKKRFSEYSAELSKTIEEIIILRDWAFERGNEVAEVTTKSTGDVQVNHGKYINIYQRQVDGSWKIARRIRNLDQPLPIK